MKALLFSALLLATSARAAVPVSLDLGQNDWQFRLASGVAAQAHPAAAVWRHATVPGNVHTDLLANGAIIDPYVGAHEAELQWIGVADWEYRTTFDVAPTELAHAHHDLVFDGIDTFADVYLNGKKLAATDNMFRTVMNCAWFSIHRSRACCPRCRRCRTSSPAIIHRRTATSRRMR